MISQERRGVVPIDVEAGRFLPGQEILERPLLFGPVGDVAVAALVPLDVVAVALLPGREDLQAAEADADLGRVGMGGPEAADGPLVRPLPDAREAVDDEDLEAGLGQGQGRGRADAPGADDDDVEALIRRHGLRPSPPGRRRSPAGPR